MHQKSSKRQQTRAIDCYFATRLMFLVSYIFSLCIFPLYRIDACECKKSKEE